MRAYPTSNCPYIIVACVQGQEVKFRRTQHKRDMAGSHKDDFHLIDNNKHISKSNDLRRTVSMVSWS